MRRLTTRLLIVLTALLVPVAAFAQATIDSLPTGRSYNSMANLIPGLTSSTNDVGGSRNDLTLTFAVHGLSGNDSRPYVSGLRLSIPGSSGANNTTLPNTAAIQEVVV